jgi:uncharacterized cupin superfamily protein
VEREQEEVFVVLDGTLTLMLGDPAQREVLPAGSVAAIQPGTPVHVRNESDDRAMFLAAMASDVRTAVDTIPASERWGSLCFYGGVVRASLRQPTQAYRCAWR